MRQFCIDRLKELLFGSLFVTVFLLSQSPLHALVIEDIRILSKLGEPLRAEVRLVTAAGETLTQGCFSSVRGAGDLPPVGAVRLTLSRQLDSPVLRVAGNRPMREPLSEFVLQVKCAGSPTLVRSFLVMVDPPTIADETLTSQPSIADGTRSPVVTTSPDARPASTAISRAPAATPIEPGARYLVRNGDMLSTIAARVEGRPDWSVWPIAQHIFAANPGAFLMGDPNRIAQGSTIYIPRLEEVDFSVTREAVNSTASPGRFAPPAPATRARRESQASQTAALAIEPVAPATAVAATPARQSVAMAVAAAPPPVMQLTVALGGDSLVKLQLRRRAIELAPATGAGTVVSGPEAVTASIPEPAPAPAPEAPDTAATSRVALPANSGGAGWLGWPGIGAGGLLAFLLGALVAGLILRRRPEPETTAAPVAGGATARPSVAPTAAWAPAAEPAAALDVEAAPEPIDIARPAHTVEVNALPELDLELPHDEPAKVGAPETLEMPQVGASLDLELPGDPTGGTGLQEVDFELLEKAYSEDYEAQFVEPHADLRSREEAPAADGDEAGDTRTPAAGQTAQYYHLENRDPADETPLPIELGENEMSGDFEDNESKIVNFPKNSSTG